MAEASDIYGILRQNLIDAGCDGDMIERCIAHARRGQWDKLMPMLAEHKAKLLGTVHESQRQIDCLDYLVYQIGKERKQEGKV